MPSAGPQTEDAADPIAGSPIAVQPATDAPDAGTTEATEATEATEVVEVPEADASAPPATEAGPDEASAPNDASTQAIAAPGPVLAAEPPTEPAGRLRRVRTRRLVAVVVATALVVAAALVAITYTSVFAADAIRVRGTHRLTKGEVLRLSGLERGMNVFHLDAAAVETRVERDPWVAEATLTKELPGTLILTIRERVPVAVVNDGSVERLVAGDGGLLAIGAPSNLPRIVAAEGATTTDPAAVRGAAAAVSAMRPDVRRQVAFVRLLPEGELALELRSGVVVTYGTQEDAVPKAEALAAMLRYAERTGERYTSIDISVPTAPAGTLVGG